MSQHAAHRLFLESVVVQGGGGEAETGDVLADQAVVAVLDRVGAIDPAKTPPECPGVRERTDAAILDFLGGCLGPGCASTEARMCRSLDNGPS